MKLLIIATLLSTTFNANAQETTTIANVDCVLPTFQLGISGHARIPAIQLKAARKALVGDESIPKRNYTVKSFNVTVLFKNKTYETVENKGGHLTAETLTLLQKVKPDDRVVYDGIIAEDDKGNEIKITPRTITLM